MMDQSALRFLVPGPNASLDTALTLMMTHSSLRDVVPGPKDRLNAVLIPETMTQMTILLPVLLRLCCPLSPAETATAVTLL